MNGEGKSLGRLISNLESDLDIQAAIKNRKSENAKEGGLRMMRERAEKLNKFLQPVTEKVPHMPEVIIAQTIASLVRAASLCFPEAMGNALMQSTRDAACRYHGYCLKCGNLIPDRKSGEGQSEFCPECKKELQEESALLEKELKD